LVTTVCAGGNTAVVGSPIDLDILPIWELTDSLLVGISGGKDSAVLLDLLVKSGRFKRIQPFFLYLVPDLSFQEEYLKLVESHYGLKVIRQPHVALSLLLRYHKYRWVSDRQTPFLKMTELEDALRQETGIKWVAYGHRIGEGWRRYAMLKGCDGIVLKSRRCFPIMNWTKQQVLAYLKVNKIPISIESKFLGFSFSSFLPDILLRIYEKFPQDYEKIRQHFPFIDAVILRARMLYEKH